MMEVTVVVEPAPGPGYRAASGGPLPAVAEGATREEALERLRAVLEARLQSGVEVVRLQVGGFTEFEEVAASLTGVAAAEDDDRPDPWDGP